MRPIRLHNPYRSNKKPRLDSRRVSDDFSLNRQGSLNSNSSFSSNCQSISAASPAVVNGLPARQDSINSENNDGPKLAENQGVTDYGDKEVKDHFDGIDLEEFNRPIDYTQQEDPNLNPAAVALPIDDVNNPIDLTKSQDDDKLSGPGNAPEDKNNNIQAPINNSDDHEKENDEASKQPSEMSSVGGENAFMTTTSNELPAQDENEQETKDSHSGHSDRRMSKTEKSLAGKKSPKKSTKKGKRKCTSEAQRELLRNWVTKPIPKAASNEELVTERDSQCSKVAEETDNNGQHAEASGDVTMKKTQEGSFPPRQVKPLDFSEPSDNDDDVEDSFDERKPSATYALTQRCQQMTQKEHHEHVLQLTQKFRKSNDEVVDNFESSQSAKVEGKSVRDDDEDDDSPGSLDLDEDEVAATFQRFSQLPDGVEVTRDEEPSPQQSTETYTYMPRDPLRRRKYSVGETWFYEPDINNNYESDPDFVYTIKELRLTGVTKNAKCIVSRKLKKTFLGGGDCWVEQPEDPVLIPLQKLNKIYEDFPKPAYSWSESAVTAKKSVGYWFTYKHNGVHAKKEITEKPVVLELYAGVGGMSRGFENAGFDAKYLVEKDTNTAGKLQENFPDKEVFEEDVDIFLERVASRAPGYPDSVGHIHASTPCQGFSDANREKDGGKNGPKNNSQVRRFVEAVERLTPDTASFENVTGIFNDKHLCFLREIVASLLLELEYNVHVCVLNASNYGDAQKRSRVFLFASKKEISLPKEPERTHGSLGHLLNPKSVRECIGDLDSIQPRPGCGKVELANGRYVRNHSIEGTELRKKKEETIVLNPDCAAPTLYNQSTGAMVHYSQARALTVREMARLQSFPDSHKLPTNRNVARKQIYNAVPVELATAVAEAIMKSSYIRNYQVNEE